MRRLRRPSACRESATAALDQSIVLRTTSLEYDLPADLVATRPCEPRDAARLMVLWRSDPGRIEHRVFGDLPAYLREGDLMVFNTSAVAPARIRARRSDTGGRVEGLFLVEQLGVGLWTILLNAGGRLREGMTLELLDGHGVVSAYGLTLAVREGEAWLARPWRRDGAGEVEARRALGEVGATPLPPYILKARRARGVSIPDATDREWYQTVYAERVDGAGPGIAGSVAAPTAGLHFTRELMERCAVACGMGGALGVGAEVRLHVGAGTFKPVETEFVEDHPIHAEWFEVPGAALDSLRRTRGEGGRVIAVGTTTVRAVESLPGEVEGGGGVGGGVMGETRLMVTPGFRFAWTDGLVTNFHLPRSTLLALVAALLTGEGEGGGGSGTGGGVERLMEVYRVAVGEGYRFYSYGDAMLILP